MPKSEAEDDREPTERVLTARSAALLLRRLLLSRRLLLLRLLPLLGLIEAAAEAAAHDGEEDTQQPRCPPAPLVHLFRRERRAQRRGDHGGKELTARGEHKQASR